MTAQEGSPTKRRKTENGAVTRIEPSLREPSANFDAKSVFLTGGTGSFGKAFLKLLLSHWTPRRITIYSRDELKQFEVGNTLRQAFPEKFSVVQFVIGDVRDVERLTAAMDKAQTDWVVHAAAMKQVPTAELHPMECIKTNINGAHNVITASVASGATKVVALSTDKAANPVNLYGATKLASDKLFVAANREYEHKVTRFSVVRYGNVLGSRGSVVPFWMEKLTAGGSSLPVTDQQMTRFWLTLEQAVNFVISSFSMMRGGEVYVPKIGAMNMVELAKTLGGEKVGIDVIGIRPGEKLHEIMITKEDAAQTVKLADRYVICPINPPEGCGDLAHYTSEQVEGNPVAAGFEFVSDEADVLSHEAVREMLKRDQELGINLLPQFDFSGW